MFNTLEIANAFYTARTAAQVTILGDRYLTSSDTSAQHLAVQNSTPFTVRMMETAANVVADRRVGHIVDLTMAGFQYYQAPTIAVQYVAGPALIAAGVAVAELDRLLPARTAKRTRVSTLIGNILQTAGAFLTPGFSSIEKILAFGRNTLGAAYESTTETPSQILQTPRSRVMDSPAVLTSVLLPNVGERSPSSSSPSSSPSDPLSENSCSHDDASESKEKEAEASLKQDKNEQDASSDKETSSDASSSASSSPKASTSKEEAQHSDLFQKNSPSSTPSTTTSASRSTSTAQHASPNSNAHGQQQGKQQSKQRWRR